MSRPLRLEFNGAIYHITSRGDRQEEIFDDNEDRVKFLEILGNVVSRYNWLCHAYCLMDNHYHLIVETPDGNLSQGMRQLNGVFTQATNRRHRRSGHLFQGRYKAILIEKESYLLELSRYVVLNPVRAKGMVRRLEEWLWSSYPAMIGAINPPGWLTTDWILSQFGNRRSRVQEKYRQFVLDGVKNQSDIWANLKGHIYLGDGAFVTSMQEKIGSEKQDLNIPRTQTRSIPVSIDEIVQRTNDRNTAIVEAYASGGYSQREIGEYFDLHPSTVGVIVRRID